MAKTATRSPLVTVFYDGASPRWRTRIAIYKLEARRGELDIAWRDVSEEPEALDAHGIEDARRRLHVLDPDGTLLAGADALALLWSALPGYRRLGRLVASPGFNALARACCESRLVDAAQRLRQNLRSRGERARGERDGESRRPAAEGRVS